MLERTRPVLVLIALLWLAECVDQLPFGLQLDQYGIVPRNVTGLRGVVFAPFLHANFAHLIANTLPLFFLGWLANLGQTRRGHFALLCAELILLTGVATWAVADWGQDPVGIHIGASGLVYGLFGYVLARALFEFRLSSILLAIVAIVLYGGLVRGLLSEDPTVSWEGHLTGLIAGIVVAPRKRPKGGKRGPDERT